MNPAYVNMATEFYNPTPHDKILDSMIIAIKLSYAYNYRSF